MVHLDTKRSVYPQSKKPSCKQCRASHACWQCKVSPPCSAGRKCLSASPGGLEQAAGDESPRCHCGIANWSTGASHYSPSSLSILSRTRGSPSANASAATSETCRPANFASRHSSACFRLSNGMRTSGLVPPRRITRRRGHIPLDGAAPSSSDLETTCSFIHAGKATRPPTSLSPPKFGDSSVERDSSGC